MKFTEARALFETNPLPPLILITRGSGYDRERLFPNRALSAGELSPRQLSDELTSGLLFSKERLLVIRHINKLDTACVKIFLNYAQNPDPKVTLVCEGESAPVQLVKVFEEKGAHLDLGRLPPWEEEKQAIHWLCQESKGALSPYLAKEIVERVGADKWVLKGELDKLLSYTGGGKISSEAIEALLVGSVEGSVWELGRAIMGRDLKRAFEILPTLNEGMGLFGILAALRSQMQTGLLCLSYQDKSKLQKALPKLKGRQLDRMIELATRYGKAPFRRALSRIYELETRAKKETLSERIALEVLAAEMIGI